jgi:putative acetyltransferase
MNIRPAFVADSEPIRRIYLSAFSDGERELVSALAVDLLGGDPAPAQNLSLVAEIDGLLVGQVAFSPVSIASQEQFRGYILAPLGVRPEYQQHGVGTELVKHGLQLLNGMRAPVVFVYGDPAYYGRFGFSADTARPYSAPYPLEHPFGWQALWLDERVPDHQPAAISCVAALHKPQLW